MAAPGLAIRLHLVKVAIDEADLLDIEGTTLLQQLLVY